MSYTSEKNVQILIALMKAHGIKKVIASPGTTNITFVASIQHDPFFEVISSADERSAAYIACGLAAESGEPVALTCTGATASRNYIPGLTEAFYRKLPVLAITSAQHLGRVGQNAPQVIDRSAQLNDMVKTSVTLNTVHSSEDAWDCNVKANTALLELFHNGGGPVHINLVTEYSHNFDTKKLPSQRVIKRIGYDSAFPPFKAGRIGIFVGNHKPWNKELEDAVDEFCEKYNGVVFCDHTSNYHGKYGVQFNLISAQDEYKSGLNICDILIDIGDVSGSYMGAFNASVWRVSEDGLIKDTFRNLSVVFEMSELGFFNRFNALKSSKGNTDYFNRCKDLYREIESRIPELPFSNIWAAQNTAKKIPPFSSLHFGILNSLRSWNFFEIDNSINCFSNTGGFGIDGDLSSLIGASFADRDKLVFGIIGDLAFFYDMNSLGNRHVGNNVRIMLINNGCGTEFRNYNHFAHMFGEDASPYISAEGHYGNKSPELVKHYCQDLGFSYLCATNKDEFLSCIDIFTDPQKSEKPILLEIFTDPKDESTALKEIHNIMKSNKTVTEQMKSALKNSVRMKLSEEKITLLKELIKK